jgi:MerR family mercuric resistance operon transcriptional regulator
MTSRPLLIGELASRAGVHVQTVRFYERRGLLRCRARSTAGYRQYDLEAVRRVRTIKRAQGLGFRLAEIAELVGNGTAPDRIGRLVTAKLREIDASIRDLRVQRRRLAVLMKSCDCAGDTSRCRILEE